MDPGTAAIISSLLGIGSSIAGGLLSGRKQGSDDLRKLLKQQLKPDPLDQIAKQQAAALREYLFIRGLIEAQEDRMLRDARLRMAGFTPEYTTIPYLYGPSVITRGEKGPDKIIPIPGGVTDVVPGMDRALRLLGLTAPQTQAAVGTGAAAVAETPEQAAARKAYEFLAPILLALRNQTLHTHVRNPISGPLIEQLRSGELTPIEANIPERVREKIGIPYRIARKGKDITGIVRFPEGTDLSGLPEEITFGRGEAARAREFLNLLKANRLLELADFIRSLAG